MAVTASKLLTSINIKYKTGVDANGKDISKSKKVGNIKVTATDADIYAVGTAIGGLLKYQILEIQKSDDNLLINA
ncbi:MAG TPA: DUF1659 domain-containing protein [Clostridiaceae bacterium]